MTTSPSTNRRPWLMAYAVALAVVWIVTVLTWDVRSGSNPELSTVAQLLQYLLVLAASTVIALIARLAAAAMPEDETVELFDGRLTFASDGGSGHAFWLALAVGTGTMLVNIALLIAADALVGARDPGTWLAWIGGGLAVGCLLGLAGAMVASVLAMVVRRRAHA
ncbi:MAG TPA: hypothetical protein VFV59_05060 [Candidatus Limnocylindria bacterium]|nr:hypothetical protein [Candidatus Limnocylindria bacterium]